MALAATGVFEVRPDGSGDQTGFFNAARGGVDYSQQTLAQMRVFDGHTTSSTTVTSAGGLFTAAMVGNGLSIVGDSFYEIVAVVNATTVTVDRNTSAATGATLVVGGATTLVSGGFSAVFQGVLVPGHKLWLRGTNAAGVATAYTVSSSFSTPAGSHDNPLSIEGYRTVRGDGGRAEIAAPAINVITVNSYQIWKNIYAHGAANGWAGANFNVPGNQVYFENVWVATAGDVAALTVSGSNCVFKNCLLDGNNSSVNSPVLVVSGSAATFLYCVMKNALSWGGAWLDGGLGASFHGCIFWNNAGYGFRENGATGNGFFRKCLFWGNKASGQGPGTGAKIGGASTALTGWVFQECLFGNNAGYDVDYDLEDASAFTGAAEWLTKTWSCNAFYTTGTARYHQLPANPDDTTLPGDPFVASASGNFALNGLSAAGALLLANPCSTTFVDGLNSVSQLAGYADLAPAPSAAVSMRSLWRELTNERDSGTIPDTTVDIYINRGLEALNRIVRYHWKTDSSAIALVAGTQEYPLPLDLIEILWVEWQGRELDKGDIDLWRRGTDPWRTEADGSLREWAHYGQTLVFRPLPSAACVAKQASPIIRYVSKPDDFAASGPLQLNSQDWPVPVYYGAALWSIAHPESALSASRAQDLMNLFLQEADRLKVDYADRGLQK